MSSARTSFDVVLPLNAVSQLTNIESIEMRRHEYQHEMSIVRLINQRQLDLRSGDPIIVTASGAAGGSEVFVGYVDHVRDSLSLDSKHRSTAVVCAGPTWYMQQARQRVWRDTTISRIARTICAEYRLTIDVEDHPTVRTFNQAGESDWSFLCRLAKRYGYVVYPTQAVVHFVSRTKNLDRTQRSAARFDFHPPASNIASDIYSFKPIIGDGPQLGKAARVMQTVHPVTAELISFKDLGAPVFTTRRSATEAIFTRFNPSSTPVSAADLRAQVEGARDHHLWTYQARASTKGIANIHPMSALYLENLDNQWDGYWTVTGVCHHFKQHFIDTMDLELGTNSLGPPATNFIPGVTPMTVNGNIPSPSRRLSSTTVALPPLTSRGGPNNPLRWLGTPASLDPVPSA